MCKTILVHANDERRFAGLAAAAVELARVHGAHLIGLSAMPQIAYPAYAVGAADAIIVDEETRLYKAAAGQLQATFEQVTAEAALAGFTAEWRSLGSGFEAASSVVVRQARAADLVMVCQADPGWSETQRYDAPDVIAIEAGRPVVIVPNEGKQSLLAKRVLVAWNGSREATRAAFDALPLLKRADEVKVLWIDPQDEAGEAGDLPCADLCAALGRHGVTCEATQPASPQESAEDTILSEAKLLGSDLIVMGCYGHSRMREYILGGASRHILSAATIPVLMSH